MSSFVSLLALVASVAALGPDPVLLGTSGNYAVLAKTGVSTVPQSTIVGDTGLSPAATTYYTGFSYEFNYGTTYATSGQVVGNMYAASMTSPTPSILTTAVSDMQTAYTDASSRAGPDYLNLGAGTVGGYTLAPGLYNWGSTIQVTADCIISGSANDTWIFQTTGDLIVSNDVEVTLAGGALASNIVWVVAGATTIGVGAHWEGVILDQTAIHLQTGASINGRLLAQSAVTLQSSTVNSLGPDSNSTIPASGSNSTVPTNSTVADSRKRAVHFSSSRL